MFEYYTVASIFTLASFLVLGILVHENNRLTKVRKSRFIMTVSIIAFSMIVEWLGLFLNEAPEWTRILHSVVKCLDYITTPMAGICFLNQVAEKPRFAIPMWILNGVNIIFQFISLFTGWTFYIDENNVYQHGKYYYLYVAMYLAILVLVFIEFIRYGRQFKKQNRISLFAIIALVFAAIVVQNVLDFRVFYIVSGFATILLFIHFSEFVQQLGDYKIRYQKKLLETDALTGLYSRYAYSEEIEMYEKNGLPENLVVFSIDINELKSVNDSLGHLAGDELIKGGAECISKVFGKKGKCFRTGGDEFIVLAKCSSEEAESLHTKFTESFQNWHGQLVKNISLSGGYASAADYAGYPIEKLIGEADRKMYEDKDRYYTSTKKKRRR